MDLDENKIIEWAMYYASYDELKVVATNLYRIYAEQREQHYPEEKLKAKEIKTAIHYAKTKKYKEHKLGIATTFVKPHRKKNKNKKNNYAWKETRPAKKQITEYKIKTSKY